MELELYRTYFPNGTNGEIYHDGKRLCFSIELPWLNNKHQVSCIPESRYQLEKRFTEKHGWHLLLVHVKNREGILIHPANDALKELHGCIAPVSLLMAEGKGLRSCIACEKVYTMAFDAMERKEPVYLTIIKKVEKVEGVENVEKLRGLDVERVRGLEG
jgi:hypothetical protein